MDNAELAKELRELRDLLLIGGYEEAHTLRYLSIATEIEEHPEDVNQVAREGRLEEIPGVGRQIAVYLKEYLQTGTSAKRKEAETLAPAGTLALLQLSGVGPKTVRRLYHEFQIASIEDLRKALTEGTLRKAKGIGPKTLERWQTAVERLRA